MSHNFLLKASFHQSLLEIDQEEANRVQAEGCDHCSGALHRSNYPRIGFGIATELAHFYDSRLSFCCCNCRRRKTPASVRFCNRRRFISSIFLLLCALRLSPSDASCERLARRFGVHISVSTWQRWQAWWQRLPTSPLWQPVKVRLGLFELRTPLPKSLLRLFSETSLASRLRRLLCFLSSLRCSIFQVIEVR